MFTSLSNSTYRDVPGSPLEELKKKVRIDVSTANHHSVNRWIEWAESLYKQGGVSYGANQLEDAYVCYMRGSTIILEVVRNHAHYDMIRKDPVYLQLKEDTAKIVVDLETIAHELEEYQQQQQPEPQPTPSRSSPLKWAEGAKIVRLPSTLSGIQMAPNVEPKELAKWMTDKSNPHNVLLLDIRRRGEFEHACLKHQWILQIEPAVLQPNIGIDMIEKSLAYNPSQEQMLFTRRDEFDVIVYYDKSSRLFDVSGPLRYFHAALTNSSPLRNRSRPIMLLEGGFDAWYATFHEQGVFHFEKSQKRTTFIDNPFNGFTATYSPMYDGPPAAAKIAAARRNDPQLSYSPSPQPPSDPQWYHPPTGVTPPRHHPSQRSPAIPSAMAPPRSLKMTPPSNGGHIGKTGLRNLGNTCYMNSIIQCLSATLPLARYFLSGDFKKVQVDRRMNKGSGGVIAHSFAELLHVMWGEQYNFVSPVSFWEAFKRQFSQFDLADHQQDSHEFLTCLLNCLNEDLNTATAKNVLPAADLDQLPEWQASQLAWETELSMSNSIIVSLFRGQQSNKLTCPDCKTTSTTYEPFMELILHLSADKKRKLSTLYDCLDDYFKEEILSKDDAWNCPCCRKRRRARKRLSLARLPDVLLVHLKRFSNEWHFTNKVDRLINFPVRGLDLSRYVPQTMIPPNQQSRPSFKYDLYAVSNHYGSSLAGGHYTSYVRNGYGGEWNCFDDSRYYLYDERRVMSSAAYILFYVRSFV